MNRQSLIQPVRVNIIVLVGVTLYTAPALPQPGANRCLRSICDQGSCIEEKKATKKKPSPVVVEPPKRDGKNTRYWLTGEIKARYVLGFAWPGGKELEWLHKESSGAAWDTVRQFRLPDGRHALANYDTNYYYSLVFIYKPPSRKTAGKGTVRATVSTKDSSLEAWLIRHEGHDYGEHFMPVEQWRRFLGLSPEERTRQAKTFRLEGMAKVQEDEFGLLSVLKDIDLSSAKPLPPFVEYLDFEEKKAKEYYEWSLERLDMDPKARAKAKQELESRMDILNFWRQNKATESAHIYGWIGAGWGPPLREMYFP